MYCVLSLSILHRCRSEVRCKWQLSTMVDTSVGEELRGTHKMLCLSVQQLFCGWLPCQRSADAGGEHRRQWRTAHQLPGAKHCSLVHECIVQSLKMATLFQAYKKLADGLNLPAINGKYSHNQMFFIGFAQVCVC